MFYYCYLMLCSCLLRIYLFSMSSSVYLCLFLFSQFIDDLSSCVKQVTIKFSLNTYKTLCFKKTIDYLLQKTRFNKQTRN